MPKPISFKIQRHSIDFTFKSSRLRSNFYNTLRLFDSAQSTQGAFPYLCYMHSSIKHHPSTPLRAGILGGGQLGRMLLQSAANYPVETFVLENDEHCPSAHLCHHFIKGNIKDFDAVYNFGKQVDVLTIEIEAVNVDALERLEAEGVTVIPKPAVLRIIKNKIEQKKYYQHHQIPTAEFVITENKEELKALASFLPAAHKLGMGGYDGRGVELLKTAADIEKGFDAPSVLEKMVKVDKEISMIVAVAQNGETTMYPPAEMVFDPHLNFTICTSRKNILESGSHCNGGGKKFQLTGFVCCGIVC
jgi:phosphoribosylaminoimidazole carboxylase (NCAIR synthetase)